MLETVDLSLKLDKNRYARRLPELQERLYRAQRACLDAHLATVVVLEGWVASGKGGTVNVLTKRLEPRALRLHSIRRPRTIERQMPWLWRFWLKLPAYGEMAVFDQSWYGQQWFERVEDKMPRKQWERALEDVREFERTLADDGCLLVKFFLHVSKGEQGKRLKKLARDPVASWLIEPEDRKQNRRYKRYQKAAEEMLTSTEAEWAPWTVVEATDRNHARVKVLETLVTRLEVALKGRR